LNFLKYYFVVNFYVNETHQTSEMTMKVREWDDEYVFGKGILHWGTTDTFGSGHTIHGERFPLEIEFVHYKSSLGSMENALNKKNGIMIASVLYDVSFPCFFLPNFLHSSVA
jgi:hypothetical protein